MLIYTLLATVLLGVIAQEHILAPLHSIRRDALELVVVHTDHSSPTCSSVRLRAIGTYKGLLPGRILSEVLQEPHRTRAFAFAPDEELLWAEARRLCGVAAAWDFPVLREARGDETYGEGVQVPFAAPDASLYPPLEVAPLFEEQSGPSDNRVDMMFFSDGYLASDKAKFIEDARRLAVEISVNQTFDTVAPLLNFWTAFTPSNEQGIGAFGKPKDTPFGLYRPGTELRGVLYANPDAARAACFAQGMRCDYPILLGNEPLYGGLGGEFTVITPSLANGALILRHELGHSVIPVGEEYDGGFGYFGVNANSARDLSKRRGVSWAHWLADDHPNAPSQIHQHDSEHQAHQDEVYEDKEPRIERSVMPLQDYAWTMLNTSASWAATFSSAGTYARHLVRFSISGVPAEGEVQVLFDGEDLGWKPFEGIGLDRYHYDVHRNATLAPGEHNVTFVLKSKEREGTAQLCNVEVLEFGDADEFIADPGYYGIFPTYSETNLTTYRPTNEDCLMRQVTTADFCRVCTEGLWLALARRVDLIDSAKLACARGKRSLSLALVPLAQFRKTPSSMEQVSKDPSIVHHDSGSRNERYEVVWTKDGAEMEEWAGLTELADVQDGVYGVEVRFVTDEVRKDESRFLTSRAVYEVRGACGY